MLLRTLSEQVSLHPSAFPTCNVLQDVHDLAPIDQQLEQEHQEKTKVKNIQVRAEMLDCLSQSLLKVSIRNALSFLRRCSEHC